MGQGKRYAYVLLVVMLLSVFMVPSMGARAGLSETRLDANSLDGSNWSNPEADVVVEEGKIIFPSTSTEYTRYISQSPAKIDENFSDLVNVSASVKFNEMPKGKQFIIGFGLATIEAVTGEPGNVEVTFVNDGGMKVGVVAYDENGTAVQVAAAKNCGIALKKAVAVKVSVSTDSQISVSVNGKAVCKGKLPVTGEGRIGFLQTGECGVEIADLIVTHYQYERPENPNVYEDFEKEAMDASVLTSKMIDSHNLFPKGVVVEEYNGSQVLMFQNTGYAYVGTLYKYSNFEMSFDVPYIFTETIYNEAGDIEKPGQTSFTVSFGGEHADWDMEGWKSAAEAIVFHKDAVYSFNKQEELRTELTEDYFTKEEGGFSVKLSVVDNQVTVGMKWMDETKYQTVLQYQLTGGMRTGYIHIWATSTGQFAVDNIKIENKDDTPNVIETEFQSGNYDVPEDAEYEPMNRVYMEADAKEEASAFSVYWGIPLAAAISIVAMLVTAIVVHKKGRKKEAIADET